MFLLALSPILWLVVALSVIKMAPWKACLIALIISLVAGMGVWNMESARAIESVLEGVAFALRDSVEVARSLGIRIESSMLCGGGAKSPLWRAIMANVLGIPLTIPQTEEGPGYGAAMLAMVGCGAYESVSACAAALVHVTETVEPDPELVARYEERYQAFKQIYPALKNVFPRIA